MLRVAAFIDAGYFLRQVWKAIRPGVNQSRYQRSDIELRYSAFRDVFLRYISQNFKEIPLLRCYWYDGPLSSGNISTEHQKIAYLNDFKLRLGHRALESPDGKIKQKGVDGLIIADMISLAQNKVISHALLVSGDGDMVPGVGVAQSLGVRVHLLVVNSEQSTSPNLKAEVDHYSLWQISDIMEFARARGYADNASTAISGDMEQPQHDTERSQDNRPLAMPDSTTEIIEQQLGDMGAAPGNLLGEQSLLDDNNALAASRLFELLNDEEKATITASYIPHQIDKRLIRAGFEGNGFRALAEKQKRLLRAELRNLAARYTLAK